MKLDPNWITGFTDGEGTFYIGINKNDTMTAGYQVLPEFRIVQHEKDIQTLHKIKNFFGAGTVRVNHDDRYELRIRSISHINEIIIPHFTKHQLITQKKFDFLKFKKIIHIVNSKLHLTENGIAEIIKIASKMNQKNKEKAQIILKELTKNS